MHRLLLVCLAIILSLVPVRASTVIFSDLFTNTGASEAVTELVNHMINTGSAWTKVEQLSAGATTLNAVAADYAATSASATSDRLVYTMTGTATAANIDVQVTVNTFQAAQADLDPIGLGCRYVSTSSYYGFAIEQNTQKQAYIFRRTGTATGNITILSNGGTKFNVTMVNSDVLKFSCRGTTLKGYINGTEVLCATDSNLTAAGHGIWWAGVTDTSTSDVASGNEYDAISVTDFTGEGGDVGCGASSLAPFRLLLGIG